MLSTAKAIHQSLQKALKIKKRFGIAEAKQIGDALKLYWKKFDVDQFVLALNNKLERQQKDLIAEDFYKKLSTAHEITIARFNE